MMALEIAMDEMAEKLGIDPVEFRILNDTQVDPEKPERPFSQRQLVECLRIGAERFGWSKRNPQPGKVRDGRWLVGMGVAAAFRNNLADEVGGARAARQPRHRDGRDRHDRHRHRQLHDHRPDRGRDDGRAARQGRRAPRRFELSRSRAGSGGQWGANSSTAGVYAACVKLREAVAQKLGFNSADAVFADGQVRSGNRSVPLGAGRGRRRPRRRGRDRVRRPRQEVPAIDLRRAFRRGRRRCRDRRDPRAAHARGVRRRPHPQSQDRRAAR